MKEVCKNCRHCYTLYTPPANGSDAKYEYCCTLMLDERQVMRLDNVNTDHCECLDRERKRVCCNCEHRILGDSDQCEIDGHYISYLECFYGWCQRWKQGHLKDGRKNK